MNFETAFREWSKTPITECIPVSGGCISNAQKIQTQDGQTYFCKHSTQATSLFMEEAEGLSAIANTNTIATPDPIFVSQHILVLSWFDSERPTKKFWKSFGQKLAGLHRTPMKQFGFSRDNHIGRTPQSNPTVSINESTWADYFLTHRLTPLVNILNGSDTRQHRATNSETRQALHHEIYQTLHNAFTRAKPKIEEILSQVTDPPSLVHGDLWSGNFLCGTNQTPVLIDPAPYQGHREVDLAMTELFGGFAPEFYEAYEASFPLQDGYPRRKSIYNLYHLLNHWILFGGGYAQQSLQILESLA